jgi:hypothetical protein
MVLGHLEENDFCIDSTRRLALPDGGSLPPSAHLLGRGRTVHVVDGSHWYQAAV